MRSVSTVVELPDLMGRGRSPDGLLHDLRSHEARGPAEGVTGQVLLVRPGGVAREGAARRQAAAAAAGPQDGGRGGGVQAGLGRQNSRGCAARAQGI